jgi:hypothetical protein
MRSHLLTTAPSVSLLETAKANTLEPYCYLRPLFTDVPGATTIADLDVLLSGNIRPDKISMALPNRYRKRYEEYPLKLRVLLIAYV